MWRLLFLLCLLAWAAAACPDEQLSSPACGKVKAGAGKLLESLCKEVGYASACAEDEKTFALLLHACGEFPDREECKGLSVCGENLDELVTCAGSTIMSTNDAYMSVQEMCTSHIMDGCDSCRGESEMPTVADPSKFKSVCKNPLKTLSGLCAMMSMAPCTKFEKWCTSNESKLCKLSDSANGDMGDSPMVMEHDETEMSESEDNTGNENESSGGGGGNYSNLVAALAVEADNCYGDPTEEKCANFQLSPEDIQDDITELCVTEGKGMPWMIGCNFWRSCEGKDSEVCDAFAILATLCHDMPGMSGCSRYKQLCAVGSRVLQCGTKPIAQAPTTTATQNSIIEACSDHSMPACFQCPRTGAACADPMSTMAELCHSMPSMAFCATFVNFCSATGNAFKQLCVPESGTFLPPMRMYFHQSLRDLILFKEWVPQNNAGYFGSVIAIIAAGVLVQFLKTWRNEKEASWYQIYTTRKDCGECPIWGDCERDGCQTECDDCSQDTRVKEPKRVFITVQQARRNVIRSAFTAVVVAVDYALMLVAMTFNVGFFLAVVFGFALGTLLFGHRSEVIEYKPIAGQILAQGARTSEPVRKNPIHEDCCSGNL